MSLLHSTLALLAFSCVLLLVGFSAREYRVGPILMLLGICGAMGIIAYRILYTTGGAG